MYPSLASERLVIFGNQEFIRHKSDSGEHKHSSSKNVGPSHEPPNTKWDFLEDKYNDCHEVSIIYKYNYKDDVYIKTTVHPMAAKTYAWEIVYNIMTCRLIVKWQLCKQATVQ
jgi:hypothetical protein